MDVRFWGVRGSCPTPGPATVRHGGNTPCVAVRTDGGHLVILDAGTGIRELGRALLAAHGDAPLSGDVFFTHAHWDHIQGLPFFTPAFRPGNHFTLWGAPSLGPSLAVMLRQQMSPEVFPVAFDDLPARMDVRTLSRWHHAGADYELHAAPVRHPGGALGFRLHPRGAPGRSLVFIPDNELAGDGAGDDGAGGRAALVAFARGAQLLVHDAMYTGAEYVQHRGWGHSSYRDAVEFALEAGVRTLVLFHHAPERDDDALDAMLALSRTMVRERGGALEVLAAAEGLSLAL